MLTTKQAAKVLGLSPLTLSTWRCRGQGPKFVKLGNLVRYRKNDLDTWLRERTVDPKSTCKTDNP